MDEKKSLLNIHGFIDYWMEQLGTNEKYKDVPKDDIRRIQNNSKDFFSLFLKSTPSFKGMDTTAIKPLLELFRIIRQQHDQQGLSSRDTTLLILSLKSSLTDYLNNTKEDTPLYQEINELLDAFGILSFELYSNEQEKIVGKQAEQIKFLQSSSKAFGTLIGTSPAMQVVYQAIGLVLENDDKPSMWSTRMLYHYFHKEIGIPITFDYHHHTFHPDELSEEAALKLAATTWPDNVRQCTHYSESRAREKQDDKIRAQAHSDYIKDEINTYGHELDIVIEAKAKELALFEYRNIYQYNNKKVLV